MTPTASEHGWIELSHVLRESLPRMPDFPAPVIRRLKSIPEDPLNLTEIQFVCHFGTHVDAPCHFIPEGPAIDAIPLERLIGPGVVVRVNCSPEGLIDLPDLIEADIRPHDVVVLDTGWWRHVADETYEHHPSVSLAAANWLAERQAKLLAVDFPTPDIAHDLRGAGFDWPVHHVLLEAGVLIAENITNLAALGPGRAEFMFMALPIAGADGAPARVIARRAA